MANKQNKKTTTSQLSEIPVDETLEITIHRDTNEIVLRNPKDDKVVRMRATVEESHPSDEAEKPIAPLTPEQFHDGISRLTKLGFAFSPDLRPEVVRKTDAPDPVDDVAYRKLQEDYPSLPYEAGLVIYQTLTGGNKESELLGGAESLKEKSKIATEFLIDENFKADFFFRHALKIPFLESIDWEVVIKTHERGVPGPIAVPYSIVTMVMHDSNANRGNEHQNITVALNANLVDKLLARLTEIRTALKSSATMCGTIDKKGKE